MLVEYAVTRCKLLGSSEQRGEFRCGDDPRGFVTVESEQPALFAGHQIIGLAAFSAVSPTTRA